MVSWVSENGGSMGSLTFYFDFLSPYSYLAWTWLRENQDFIRQNCHLILKPVTLAPVIKANDTKGPAEIPTKRDYLMKDCLRFSALRNIPFRAPKSLPFNSLYALRVSLLGCSGPEQLKTIDGLYRAAWEHGRDLGNSETVEDVLNSLGLPGAKWLERVGDKDLRKALKQNTNEAIERGVFGLPTFLVNNGDKTELFWGNDSIPSLKLYIEGKDPLENQEIKDKYHEFQSSYLELG
jgi:2-hydroxychromene-2-carboxylate isomerase